MRRIVRFALVVAAASMAACGTQGAQPLDEAASGGSARSVISAASSALGGSAAPAAPSQGEDGPAPGAQALQGTAAPRAGLGAAAGATDGAGGGTGSASGAGATSQSPSATATPPASAPPSATPGDDDEGVPFGNTQSPGFPLRAKVTPKCVERGQDLRVEVTTRPFASIAAAIAYSEIDEGAPYSLGAADPNGKWIWIVPVAPTAPYGKAWAAISAQDRSPDSNDEGAKTSGEGAAKKYPFEVKESC